MSAAMRNSDRSDITDLDDWVDKMFDPIIQNDSVTGLTNSSAVQQSLRGNGESHVVR